MDNLIVPLGITDDDLGISWALPGNNWEMTWALLWQNLARLADTFGQFWQSITEYNRVLQSIT